MNRAAYKSFVLQTILASVLIVVIAAGAAIAQDGETDQTQVRNREQIRDNAQDPQGDMLRQRIRERIESDQGLQEQDRERLRKHLGECEQLGLDDATVAQLFDESQPLQKQMRMQERVLEMKREGLPTDPVMRKLQEGRRKGVGEEQLEQVCERMEQNVRVANRFMRRAYEDGVTPGNDEAERRRTEEMARCMWRGLEEGDLDQIRNRARLRLRDGSCTTEDLTTAAETASRLTEMGAERERSVRLSGDALQNGYTAKEMRQLRWMVLTAHMNGGPPDEVFGTLERGIRNHEQLGQMVQNMWQRGWMGPADEHGGRGGQAHGDDAGGGGPGGHGQGGGDDPKGGNGGGGNDGGGSGGGNDGGGGGNGGGGN